MRAKKVVFATLVLSLFAVQAGATTFSGSVLGQWQNVVSLDPSDIYSINNNDAVGTADFNWGIPATTTFDNQFTFNGLNFDNVGENTAFAIGDFSYRNGSTYNSTGIDGVDLLVNLALTNPLSIADNYNFNFSIINTPNNSGDPVIDGDIVKSAGGFSSTTFNYLGTDYTLNLLGFSSDGGVTIRTDFSSPEGADQHAQLFARITSEIPHNVPEPGSLSMILVGLCGLGGFSFLRKK